MRNYLEEWLSEEENAVALPDAVRPKPLRRPGTQAGEGAASAGRTSGKQMEDDRARMARTEKPGGEDSASGTRETAGEAGAHGALPTAWRESERKQTAKGALYAAMGRLGRVDRLAEGATRGQTLPLALPIQPGGTTGVEALDRAVQRDARRYDSGFSLY